MTNKTDLAALPSFGLPYTDKLHAVASSSSRQLFFRWPSFKIPLMAAMHGALLIALWRPFFAAITGECSCPEEVKKKVSIL